MPDQIDPFDPLRATDADVVGALERPPPGHPAVGRLRARLAPWVAWFGWQRLVLGALTVVGLVVGRLVAAAGSRPADRGRVAVHGDVARDAVVRRDRRPVTSGGVATGAVDRAGDARRARRRRGRRARRVRARGRGAHRRCRGRRGRSDSRLRRRCAQPGGTAARRRAGVRARRGRGAATAAGRRRAGLVGAASVRSISTGRRRPSWTPCRASVRRRRRRSWTIASRTARSPRSTTSNRSAASGRPSWPRSVRW